MKPKLRTFLSCVLVTVLVNGEAFQPTNVNGDPIPVFNYNGTTEVQQCPVRVIDRVAELRAKY